MRVAQTFQPSGPRSASRTTSSTVCVTGPGRAARLPPLPAFQRGAPQLYGTATPGPCAAGHQERAWPRLLRWPRGTLGPHPEATQLCAEAPPLLPAQPFLRRVTLHKPRPFHGPQLQHLCSQEWKSQDAQLPSRPEAPGLFSPAPPAEPGRGWRHARALCAL